MRILRAGRFRFLSLSQRPAKLPLVPPKKNSLSTEPEAPLHIAIIPEGPRVFLLDTMSFIFRAYHAMSRARPMSTRSGVPTAAVYVFVNMLRKLREDFQPEYIAAAFDLSGPTFRDEQAAAMPTHRKVDSKTGEVRDVEYKGYKANRTAMPEDLGQQIPYMRRALEAFRIPILESQRYEADDVIGTLARKASSDHVVIVVSQDKDMMQLVTDRVLILNPMKENLVSDPKKVEEILGVPPSRVVDVMALRGDSVDNIPGAPGIGDKGSVELIQRFGSVEAALDHADEVERKTYRESLQQNREMVLLSKQLVTIDTDVPVEFDLEKMRSQEPDTEALRTLFSELEFTSMLKELTPADVALPEFVTDLIEGTFAAIVDETIQQMQAYAKLVEGSAPSLAVALSDANTATSAIPEADAEASADADHQARDADDVSQPPAQMSFLAMPSEATAEPPTVPTAIQAPLAPEPQSSSFRIAISAEPGKASIVPLESPAGERVRGVLQDAALPKAIHNYKAALRTLAPHGVTLAGVRDEPMLYSYLLNPTLSSHTLDDLVVRNLNARLASSPGSAADFSGRLARKLRPEVEQAGLLPLYETMDLPLVPVLARMEAAGVKVDTAVLAEMSSRLEREAAAKAREVFDIVGTEFNINSPKQLGDILFNRLQLSPPGRGPKGKQASTAADVLEALALVHPVPRLVIEFRQFSKLKSTYVDALPQLIDARTGRVHTTFDQTGTATGRISSSNPNLQNIPIRTELGREIRAAFIAEPGHVLLAADYSQIELRLLAHLSQDPMLVEAYRRGDDIHTLTAAEVFGVPPMMITSEHRSRAKAVNFGIVYGLSPFGLSQQLGIDQKEAKRYIEAYFEKYAGVRTFIDRTLDEARRENKVRTLFGRVRPIPDIHSKNPNMRGFAERTAVNTPLQGTAADLIKVAMLRIDAAIRERKLASRMTLQVHDELVFEVPESEVEEMRTLVQHQMENAHALSVPLVAEVGVGKNWRDMD